LVALAARLGAEPVAGQAGTSPGVSLR
jgi:hypothetical protein